MVRSNRQLVERMALIWHDWFATSNAEVGSQRLMLRQNDLFRKHGAGLVRQPAGRRHARPGDAAVPHRASTTTRTRPNENYGREVMELFTLGAGPRLHRERRARAGARADRLPGRLVDGLGMHNFRFDAEAARPGPQEDPRPEGQLRLARLLPSSASSTTTTRRFFVEKLWSLLHPGAGPAPRRGSALERLYVASGYSIAPGAARRSCRHPLLLRRPAHGQAAGRVPGRACCARSARTIDTDSWTWISGMMRPAPVLPAERRRLGRHALARHRDLARSLDRHAVTAIGKRELEPDGTYGADRDAGRRGRRRDRLLGQPDDLGADRATRCSPSRSAAPRRQHATGSARATRRCARTRCAC